MPSAADYEANLGADIYSSTLCKDTHILEYVGAQGWCACC